MLYRAELQKADGATMRASTRSLVGLLIVAAASVPLPAAAEGPPAPVAVSTGGASGSGRIEDGRSCEDGGDGRYWHYEYTGGVEPGSFSQRPAELRLHLDLHHDETEANAFLLDDESHASLLDDRGTIRVRLRTAGDECLEEPTLSFDGSTASGTGTWQVDRGAGAYEGVSGNGTFTVSAAVDPGADNPWSLDLQGAFEILQPSLQVDVVNTHWGGLGTDYLTRRPTVTYRITNVGNGPAFGAELAGTSSPTPGVTPLGPVPQALGDLAPGESTTVAVRYQLGLLQPCQVVILNCPFVTNVGVQWTDALDRPSSPAVNGLATKAPDFPPPL